MSEGYRKIFWGIFIATFNFKFGIIKMLPAFVGFIIISRGLNQIIEETDLESLRKAKLYSNISAIVLFFGGLLPFLGANLESNIFFQLIPIVYLTVEILLFYKVFEGSIEKLNIDNKTVLENEYIGKLRFYIIASILNNIMLCFVLTFNLEGFSTIIGILAIILRIFLMTAMSKLKKLYLNDENPDVN